MQTLTRLAAPLSALLVLAGCVFISKTDHIERKQLGAGDDTGAPDDSGVDDSGVEDSGDTAHGDDTGDTGDTGETDDTGDTHDSEDSGDSGDTSDPDSLTGSYTGTLTISADSLLADDACTGTADLTVASDSETLSGTFSCTWDGGFDTIYHDVEGTIRGSVETGSSWGVITATSSFGFTMEWDGVAAAGASAVITGNFSGDCEPEFTCTGSFTARR